MSVIFAFLFTAYRYSMWPITRELSESHVAADRRARAAKAAKPYQLAQRV
jgi:hypothetical protein